MAATADRLLQALVVSSSPVGRDPEQMRAAFQYIEDFKDQVSGAYRIASLLEECLGSRRHIPPSLGSKRAKPCLRRPSQL